MPSTLPQSRHPRPWAHRIGRLFLGFFSWRTEGQLPEGSKFVIIAAPHTSNWDLPFMLAVSYGFGVRLSFLMKHTMFWGPFGPFFRWLGGIPVDRQARHNLVQWCMEAFRQREEFVLAIPREGTRSKVRYWKTGFYWIAHDAKVPILLGFLDYKRKVGGLGPTMFPSGDLKANLEKMREFYRDISGKHPSQMGEIELQERDRAASPPS
jgi:1-acyl-sn-glycerol-3-phosphate acyltransferase